MKFKVKPRDILLGFLDAYVLVMWSNPYGRCRKEYHDYFRWRQADAVTRHKMHNSLSYLKRKNLIHIYEKRTGKFVELTKEGKKELAKWFATNQLKLPRVELWDGKWRVVMFDIPERAKPAREAFRDTLKRLGFYRLQKSVFIYPYECYKEIAFVRDCYGLGKEVKYLVVEKIEAGVDLAKLFFERGLISEMRER